MFAYSEVEQLSSYSGWRVTTKKTRANLLTRAIVKGFPYIAFEE